MGGGAPGPGWRGASPGAPAVVTAALVVALAIPALAMPTLRSDFNLLEELPSTGDGRTGYLVVGEHFDQGQLSPVTVLIQAPERDLATPDSLALLRRTHDLLAVMPGVASVSSLVSPGGEGVTPDGFRPTVQLADMAEQLVPQGGDPIEALRRLLEEDTEAGLARAAAYVEGLGRRLSRPGRRPRLPVVARRPGGFRRGGGLAARCPAGEHPAGVRLGPGGGHGRRRGRHPAARCSRPTWANWPPPTPRWKGARASGMRRPRWAPWPATASTRSSPPVWRPRCSRWPGSSPSGPTPT